MATFDADRAVRELFAAETEQGMTRRIRALSDDERAAVLERACAYVAEEGGADPMVGWVGSAAIRLLLDGGLVPGPRALSALVDAIAPDEDDEDGGFDPYGTLQATVVAAAERVVASGPEAAAAVRPTLERLRAALAPLAFKKEGRALRARVEALLGVQPIYEPEAGERWADAARASLAKMDAKERAAWSALFRQAENADSARPSAKWQKTTAGLVAALGRARFLERLGEWLPLVEKPKELRKVGWAFAPPISDGNTRLLVTLAWALGGGGEPEAARLAGDLASTCLTKIPGFGPVSSKVGNACVWALGAMSGLDGVAQLSRLKLRVKYAVAQRLIGRALDDAAARAGLTVDDVEELAVPTFGLDADGRRDEPLGDGGWTAIVALERSGVTVTFSHPSKRAPKSVPAEVKSLAEWRALKKTIGEIEQRVGLERTRLERYYLARRELSLGDLRARALTHPVVGHVARRLLWSVAEPGRPTRVGLWRKGRLADLANEAFADDDARVSLWHPLGAAADDLAVWQDLLEEEAIVQPWKQVHREVYALTADEEQTRVYSNRFAGHIVRQHQFAALANARGWTFRLMGAFDSHNTPTLALPMWGLEVDLHVDYPEDADAATSGAGIYLHISTDRVVFRRAGEADPLPLDEVPPLVFSEVMRDVDLLVGVSTIGADPKWADDRDSPLFAYWRDAALGALGPSAASRRAVVARLLRRLPNADRFSVDDRFLRVRGALRSYRVHLGSGMVLLDPTDRPLTVEARPSGLTLPFEGDARLEAILDTALTLVADDRIRDAVFREAIGG
jgi:hypothetical protein